MTNPKDWNINAVANTVMADDAKAAQIAGCLKA